MRRLALVAVLGLCLSGVAAAEPYNDPAGRFSFDKPHGWTVDVRQSPSHSYVIAGTANNECHVFAQPNPATASANPWDMVNTIRQTASFTAANWTSYANAMSEVFPHNSATFVSQSLDNTGTFPLQRAEFSSPDHPTVHAAMTLRPGLEIRVFCLTYSGADPTSVYDQVMHSVSTSHDAEWASAIQAHEAARAAAQAQAAAPPQPQQQGQHH